MTDIENFYGNLWGWQCDFSDIVFVAKLQIQLGIFGDNHTKIRKKLTKGDWRNGAYPDRVYCLDPITLKKYNFGERLAY